MTLFTSAIMETADTYIQVIKRAFQEQLENEIAKIKLETAERLDQFIKGYEESLKNRVEFKINREVNEVATTVSVQIKLNDKELLS